MTSLSMGKSREDSATFLVAADRQILVGPAAHVAAAIGLVGGDDEGDVKVGKARELKSRVNPVFEFLEGGRLHHGHVQVAGEKTGIRMIWVVSFQGSSPTTITAPPSGFCVSARLPTARPSAAT